MKKNKEYGIVSQGVLIYRSKDYFKVKKMIEKGNKEYYKNCLLTLDRGELPADNELFLVEINSSNEKN